MSHDPSVRGREAIGPDTSEAALESRNQGSGNAADSFHPQELSQYRRALTAAQIETWEWNLRTNSFSWSPAHEKIHGLAPGSFEGTLEAYQNHIHPDDRERVMRSLAKSVEEGTEHQVEYRVAATDGSIRWIEGRGIAVRDVSNEPTHMIGLCADITERKRADETIRSLLRISERLNSTLEVDTLIDILIQEAIELVGARAGAAGLHTHQGMVCRKYFQAGKELPLEYCWPPMHGLPGWLIVNKVPYLTNDAMTDTQIVHELCVQFGVKSALSTPILSNQGEVLGFFEIHNKDGGFTEADRDKLLAISHSASIAIQNALAYRRREEAEHALRESERTQRVLAEISALGSRVAVLGGDLQAMVPSVLELIAGELKVSRCGLSRVDPDAGLVIVEQEAHIGVDSLKRPFAISEYLSHLLEDALAGRTSIVSDLATDPRTAARFENIYRPLAVHAYINVPLHRKGQWVGNFWISSHQRRQWSSGEVQFAQAVADRLWQSFEQARIATELRESEERFARFMEHLPGLAWIKDLQGAYVFANGAAERAFRTPLARLYRRTDDEVFPSETAALFRENDRRAAMSGSGIQTIETLEHPDGVHHSLVHKFPIPGPDGQTALIGGMAIDVTERIKAEEALRMSEERYRAVLENQAEMVCRFRPEGTILFANGAYAHACSVSPQEMIGRNFWDFIVDEDRPSVQALLQRLTPETPEIRVENRFQTGEGERWTLWTNRALTFDSSGRVLEAQSTGVDITDRKRAEEALQQAAERLEHLNTELKKANEVLAGANQDLERFAFIASHDLQEPLRMVTAYSELLIRSVSNQANEAVGKYAAYVTEGTTRMRDLLADLLAYTELRAQKEGQVEVVDLSAVIDEVSKNLHGAIQDSGAQVTHKRLPRVRVQRRHIQSVFQNLIENAIKYRSTAPPVIEIATRIESGELRFEVRDNGIGIDPEYHVQIFEAFRRLHGRRIPGTGIGLSICQRVVERYGGKIGVESEPGSGATFWFTLPEAAVAEAEEG